MNPDRMPKLGQCDLIDGSKSPAKMDENRHVAAVQLSITVCHRQLVTGRTPVLQLLRNQF